MVGMERGRREGGRGEVWGLLKAITLNYQVEHDGKFCAEFRLDVMFSEVTLKSIILKFSSIKTS